MKTSTKIIIGVIAFFVIMIFTIGGMFISTNNTCVEMEATIKAQYKQNQNNYDNYFKTIQEIAQVPKMYVNDLKSLWYTAMKDRYGKVGSQAVWQWIKEQNPHIDTKMYEKIQATMTAGRKDFENNQKMLLDKKRVYEDTYLKKFPNSFFASVLGFPKMDLSEMDIVTSSTTEEAFKTKKTDYIKIQ